MGRGRLLRAILIVAIAALAQLLILPSAGHAIDCTLSGTPIACPFDFHSSLHLPCAPANLSAAVRVNYAAPAGYFVDKQATFVSSQGANYTTFFQDGSALYFSVPGTTKGGFGTQVSMNGIAGRTNALTNASTCPCALQKSAISSKLDEATSRVLLQGAIAGNGCKTDGSVTYDILFFVTNGPSVEEVKTQGFGGFFQIYSNRSYSASDSLSFTVVVADHATGMVYAMFSPENLKPTDFSVVPESSTVSVRSGVNEHVAVNITNLGTTTEPFSVDFSGLPLDWEYSKVTTKPLAPGERIRITVDVLAPVGANATSGYVRASSETTNVTKTAPISFQPSGFVSVASEIYSSAERVAVSSPFDVSVVLRTSSTNPSGTVYWSVFSDPPAKLSESPTGKMPSVGSATASRTIFIEKIGCGGTAYNRKLMTILRAIESNPAIADGLSSALSTYGNATAFSRDVAAFIASKNKTASMATQIIARISTAETAGLSNCSGSGDRINLGVFGVDTVSLGIFESPKTTVYVEGKGEALSMKASPENFTVPKGGSAFATVLITNNLLAETTVSLKVSQTPFRVSFPAGSTIRVPGRQSAEAQVSVSDPGTIAAQAGQVMEIVGTTSDASGEQVSASAALTITVVASRITFPVAPPASVNVGIGSSKYVAFKIMNGGSSADTFQLSVSGPGTASPQTVSLSPGESAAVNVTVTLGMDVAENAHIPVILTAKSQSTGEASSSQFAAAAVPSAILRLKRQSDALRSSADALGQNCKYYSLKNLDALLTALKDYVDRNDAANAKTAYDRARAEYDKAEKDCVTPQSGATLLIIAGIVAVVGGFYYYAKIRKKPAAVRKGPQQFAGQYPAPPQQPQQQYLGQGGQQGQQQQQYYRMPPGGQ